MLFNTNCLRRSDFTDCKEMGLCPIWALIQRKAFFWQTCPKVKFAVSSYFYLMKKSLILCVGLLFLKYRSDRAPRVVHLSPCCMFHSSLCTIQSKKFCSNFHSFVTSYLLCMEMTSSCLWLSSFLPRARYKQIALLVLMCWLVDFCIRRALRHLRINGSASSY